MWVDWCGGHYNDYYWPHLTGTIALRNDKYPIVFNSSCHGARFDWELGECHCDSWLDGGTSHERPYFGAVAAYGNTRAAKVIRANCEDRYFFKAIYKWGIKTIGDVVNHGKLDLLKRYRFRDKKAMDLVFMGMIMGEPSTGVKTKPIRGLTVSHPTSLLSGSTVCEVAVNEANLLEPVAEALVCLYREGVLHVAQMTGEDGVTVFDIDDTGSPGAGAIKLTVYERNFVTYQYDLDVE